MTSWIASSLMAASELGDIYAIREACIVCLYTQFEFSPIGFQALARTLDLGLLQDRGGVERCRH